MKKTNNILILIFLGILAFRLFFVFKTPYFSSSESYFVIRNIENIIQTGLPLFDDPLSYSGRYLLFQPLFYYLLMPFYLIFKDAILKLIPAILFSSTVFFTYLLIKKITKSKPAIYLATLSSIFIPISFTTTLNSISIYSLIIPLTLYLILMLIKIKSKINYFIFLSILLPLLHPFSLLIALAMIIYLIIAKTESLKISRLKIEAITFFIFLTLLITFIFFKKPLLELGLSVVWQNTPSLIIKEYFRDINLIEAIFSIGALPILFGVYGIVYSLIKRKKTSTFLIISVIFSIFLLLTFRLIGFNIALTLLGIFLAIISSLGFERFFEYIKLTKLFYLEKPAKFTLFLLIVLTLIIPSIIASNNLIKSTISEEEIEALNWIKENAEQDVIVLSSAEEGHYITAIAKRKNVIDTNFVSAKKINERYEEVRESLTTISEAKALQIFRKYDVTYIYFSEKTKEIYKTGDLDYIQDKNCFKTEYENAKAKVYKVRC